LSNELFINSTQKGNRIALLNEKKLVEYHLEEHDKEFIVGDIFLGLVRKVVPGLNAAFVDIGHEKDAFLHYLDLGMHFSSMRKITRSFMSNKKENRFTLNGFKKLPPIDKNGKINQVLSRNNLVLVQIIKEAISTKGPRLSCEISIAGRYLVLVPFGDYVSISKKITNKEERTRLQRLISSIKPANFGVIVRTVSEGRDVAELDRDLKNLLHKWEKGMKKLRTAKANDKIIGEMSRASSILRDMLNESFDSITTDNKEVYEEVKSYIQEIAPSKEKIVKLHNTRAKIFEAYGIEKQLKSLFGKSVTLESGGYIVIEHTEALHAIDVNSGQNSSAERDQETTAFKVNMEAAQEVVRQLRIRDMGGIIIIDFIDMQKSDNKRKLYEFVKQELNKDRSRASLLPLTKYGLMQITRQRVRPEVNITTKETCPTCNGTGKVEPVILVSDAIEQALEYLVKKQNERKPSLYLHPYLHAFFTKGLFSRQVKWLFRYGQWVRIVADSSLPITQYHFINKQGDEIELQNS